MMYCVLHQMFHSFHCVMLYLLCFSFQNQPINLLAKPLSLETSIYSMV